MNLDIQSFPCLVISEPMPGKSRLQSFLDRKPAPWPFAPPSLYPAVWGARTGKPDSFRDSPGAWGCWRTHCRLWEDVFSREWPGAVVFEDDAVFRPGFAESATAFLAAVPDDWDMIYLGGQHLKGRWLDLPGGVRRAFNVNRTHAYIVRATQRSRAAYWRLCSVQPATGQRSHVDYVFGELLERGALTAYCPAQWLCGQAAGVSTITGKTEGERFW